MGQKCAAFISSIYCFEDTFLQYIFPRRFLIDEDEDTFKLELKEAFRMYDKVPPFSHKANKQSSYKLSVLADKNKIGEVQHLGNSPKADSDSKTEEEILFQHSELQRIHHYRGPEGDPH